MSKKSIPVNPGKENEIHLLRIEYYVRLIAQVYDELLEEFANLGGSVKRIKPGKVFNFDDYPVLKPRVDKLVNATTLRVTAILDEGVDDAWLRSNVKNDALVDRVAGNTRLKKRKIQQYYNRNLEALAQARTPADQLSKSVFNITKQFKFVAENSLEVGIGEGKGARILARDMRKAVNDPEFAFRRVRDKSGKLKWSRAAERFKRENPGASGQGVYLNPQRNFERLTRTEINRSYRKADNERYKLLDFIVGYEIRLSNNPNHCPMCIALAGKYPKGFVWAGWHPQCRCYMVTILKTDEEIETDNVRILDGKQPLKRSENSVTKMPGNYNKWVDDNAEKLRASIKRDKKPYWIRDAYKDGDFEKGVNLK